MRIAVLPLLLLTGCTTNLDAFAGNGQHGAGGHVATQVPDSGASQFPPPTMEFPPTMPDPIVDPSGPFALTLLHGVVDAPRLFFCAADGSGQLHGNPAPEQGLGFGEALVATTLGGLDFSTDSFQLMAIAASADQIAGRSCREILTDRSTTITVRRSGGIAYDDAGPPNEDAGGDGGQGDGGQAAGGEVLDASLGNGIRIGFLPLVPAGSLDVGGSYLFAAAGCLGGVNLNSSDVLSLCGEGFWPGGPSLSPLLVRMSRMISATAPALQFFQASLAVGKINLRSDPSQTQGTQVAIATAVASGTIAPYPPLDSIAAPTFGDPLASASLTITSDLGETWSSSWGEALARGDLTGLDSFKGYTAVYLGPNPWAGQDGPVNWNQPAITVLLNSPQ